MWYLRGMVDICLVYDINSFTSGLIGYVDSDYDGDLIKRRSLTYYIFTFYESTISWKATLQITITLSTTEAECMSMTEGDKEGMWFHGLINNLGLDA
jgi:diacylglycerol kinase family enzyme